MQEIDDQKVIDQGSPPLLGFDSKTIQREYKINQVYKTILSSVEKAFHTITSTPINQCNTSNMNTSFTKSFEEATNIAKTLNQITLDGDSGYVSHYQESSSNSYMEESVEIKQSTTVDANSIYISEDALLERPQVNLVNNQELPKEEEDHEEYSHLFYLTESIIESSEKSEKTSFSGLEDDTETSNISSIIHSVDVITIPESKCNSSNICEENTAVNNAKGDIKSNNSPIIHKFIKPCVSPSKIKKKIFSPPKMCHAMPGNENQENDKNVLNVNLMQNEQKVPQMLRDGKSSNLENDTKNFTERVFYTESDSETQAVALPLPTNPIKLSRKRASSSFDKLADLNADSDMSGSYTNISKIITEKQLKDVSDNFCLSPELFSDDDSAIAPVQHLFPTTLKSLYEEQFVTKSDQMLLKKTRESLMGILPPPSITRVEMSLEEMLNRIRQNGHLFLSKEEVCNRKKYINIGQTDDIQINNTKNKYDNKVSTVIKQKSLLINYNDESVHTVEWPAILNCRYHGLHYNRNKVVEEFEHLCQKYGERYVNAETQSSCTVFSSEISSPKRKFSKLRKIAKSPGRRLSHLAKRISFSKDSLQSSSSYVGINRSKQILIDARKLSMVSKSPRKTPRKSPRKTARKSPQKAFCKSPRKTPHKGPRISPRKKHHQHLLQKYLLQLNEPSTSSCASISSNKKDTPQNQLDCLSSISQPSSVFSIGSTVTEPSAPSTSKRQTPRRALFISPKKVSPQKGICSLYSKKRLTPKRALFSPEKKVSAENLCDKKRKRIEEDIFMGSKIPRVTSGIRSTGSTAGNSRHSQTQELNEHHKKKLLWAVSEALRSLNITMAHPQFKVFASVLARVTRRLLPNLNTAGPRPEGSTSELMLRIARQNVFAVTRGKTLEEILQDVEKNNLKTKLSFNNLLMQNGQSRHLIRNEKVERIRRAINFSEDTSFGSKKSNI